MGNRATLAMQDVIRAEIDVLRKEADSASQAYFAAKTVREAVRADAALRLRLDARGRFWAPALYGLDCVFFLSLRKFFDTDTRSHSFKNLLALCENHGGVFSRRALAQRRAPEVRSDAEWEACVARAFVPAKGYFRRLGAAVDAELARLRFHEVYRAISDKIIAHNETVSIPKIDELLAHTESRDSEALLALMRNLGDGFLALWSRGDEPRLAAGPDALAEQVAEDTRRVLAGR